MQSILGSPLFLICGVLLLLTVFAIGVYNNLSVSKQKVKESFADIDTLLKKRFDLLPNLVETVKGFAKQESAVFEKIAALRSGYMSAQTVDQKVEIANQFTGAMRGFYAVSEQYPELKSNTNFLQLQASLQEIEGEIQNSRRYFNASVRNYNNGLVTFPQNILAGIFGFKEEKYFETAESERENIKVQF